MKKMTGLEFIIAEQERGGESDMRSSKRVGMSQPGYTKAKRNGVSFRLENFVRYANSTGYEVIVMPKEHAGILSDKAVIIRETQEECLFDDDES